MDPSQMIPMISGLFTGPYGVLVGVGLTIAYSWAKVRYPNLLARLPHLIPPATPATPDPATPAPPATPAATGHPILDSLLKILGQTRAATVLAGEVHRMISETPPEPSQPVVKLPAT